MKNTRKDFTTEEIPKDDHISTEDILSPLLDSARSEADEFARAVQVETSGFAKRKLDASGNLLEQVADVLRNSPASDEVPNPISQTAADYIDIAAERIKTVDPDHALKTVGTTLREHPAPLAIGAAAVGFFAARLISSSLAATKNQGDNHV